MKSSETEDNLFLPNSCDVYTVFLGILVTELLAFVFVLAPLSETGYDWDYVAKNLVTDLAMVSLFMQWVTLGCMGLLCLIRRWLSHNDIIASFITYLLILMMTWLVSEIAWRVNLCSSNHYLLFIGRNLGISTIISAIALRYFYVQSQWKKETKANADNQAQALQSRIRPHFLFNSMNTIASLIRFQPEKAELVVEEFAELFRASLTNTKTFVTFKKELALCRQYLDIEALRLGERLQLVWKVDKVPEDALLPLLSLQPLLENAIYHGIQPLEEGGTISITGLFDGKQIQLEVENPLAATLSPHKGNRIAQKNLQQRLLVFYGTQAKLIVQRETDTYRVIMSFPYKNQYDENNYRR
jgi:two-component system sensor histidine kinase AlgZ